MGNNPDESKVMALVMPEECNALAEGWLSYLI
jgi:hypothetical protein